MFFVWCVIRYGGRNVKVSKVCYRYGWRNVKVSKVWYKYGWRNVEFENRDKYIK